MNEVAIGIIGLVIILFMFLTGIELAFAMIVMGFWASPTLPRGMQPSVFWPKMFITFSAPIALPLSPSLCSWVRWHSTRVLPKGFFDSAHKFVGHIPGGLAMSTVVGATAFKAICGPSPATAATFASVAIPEMDHYGYTRKLSTGIVATVGTLGIILPPSVTLIIYGVITDVSIGGSFWRASFPACSLPFYLSALFTAGVK